ncbi:MAG: dTDP-glucose 4,6-dehydratase, partial [Terracidiphilus sp.]
MAATSSVWLITGGAGFIGSQFLRLLLAERPDLAVVNLDALAYSGRRENFAELEYSPRFRFIQADVADAAAIARAVADVRPRVVVHFAAESHVDRSIVAADAFVRTNVLGTQVLLDAVRRFQVERFLYVSTDEVYGSLGPEGSFSESSPLAPNSPYAASKAAGDLLVRAAVRTHGLDAVITRGSNTYGPRQFPEKL